MLNVVGVGSVVMVMGVGVVVVTVTTTEGVVGGMVVVGGMEVGPRRGMR